MRRLLVIAALAVLGSSFGVRAAPLPSTTCAVSGWGVMYCAMKTPMGGRLLYVVQDSIDVRVVRGGAVISRVCLDGPVIGTRALPSVKKGDVVQVRAISKVTFAVVSVVSGGNYSYGPGGAIPCP